MTPAAGPGTVPTGNIYDKYATKNPIERRLVATFLRRLESLLPAAAPATVLEVGVGEGQVSRRVAARYPGTLAIGLDLPDPELASRWDVIDAHGVFGDAGRLPFPDGAFDLVLAIEVLEHVPDPDAAIAELARVAKPGATAILSVPSEPLWRGLNLLRGKYVRDLGNTPGHMQHWSPKAFTRLVSRSFEIRSVSRPVPWTMVGATRRAR